MKVNQVSDVSYILNSKYFSDWIMVADLVNEYLINECKTIALLALNLECKNDLTKLFQEHYKISENSEIEYKTLKVLKAEDINDNRWLKSMQISYDELIKSCVDFDLEYLFNDRVLLDVFGNALKLEDIPIYANISSLNSSRLFFYSLPNINHITERVQHGIKAKWSGYFHQKNKNFLSVDRIKEHAIIFIIDPASEVRLLNNERVIFQYSHTKHLLQHMQAFIDRGYSVLLDQKGAEKIIVADSVIPELTINNYIGREELELKYRIVGYCSIYMTDFLNSFYIHRKEVVSILIQPAVHWMENARIFQPNFLTVVQAIAPFIDVVVTQNERMIELTKALLELGGCRADKASYLTIPLSIWTKQNVDSNIRELIRSKYKFKDDNKVIVNGGGAWSWTDTEKFMESFLIYCKTNPNTKLRFVQLGLTQKSNTDHLETIEGINSLLNKYSDIAKDFLIVEDWDVANKILPDALQAFDYGFSLSKESVEAFQAHRVRLTEYVQYNIPPIINSFDSLSPKMTDSAYIVSNSFEYGELFKYIEMETRESYSRRKVNLHNVIKYINNIGNSNKLVDTFERVNPSAKFENVKWVKRHFESVLNELIESKFLDPLSQRATLNEDQYNERQADRLQVKNNIPYIFKLLNRIARTVLPNNFYLYLLAKAKRVLMN